MGTKEQLIDAILSKTPLHVAPAMSQVSIEGGAEKAKPVQSIYEIVECERNAGNWVRYDPEQEKEILRAIRSDQACELKIGRNQFRVERNGTQFWQISLTEQCKRCREVVIDSPESCPTCGATGKDYPMTGWTKGTEGFLCERAVRITEIRPEGSPRRRLLK